MNKSSTAGAISFNNEDSHYQEFARTLNKRVNEYFKEKGISKFGNFTMYIKTLSMFMIYTGPFIYLIAMEPQGWSALVALVIMGLGYSGIGLSVMHDAVHGAYSSTPWINKALGYSLNLLGGNALNWRIQHNVLHHTYTNIEEHDEDIAPKAILRFSPQAPLWSIHKYQHIYVWLFYALGTFFWVTFKDFTKIRIYHREGMLEKHSKSVAIEYTILILSKIIYYTYIIGLPVYLTEYTGGQIFFGFLLMHLVAGTALAMIFQPAHLMEEVEYPAPSINGKMKYSWLVHQLYTTTNFATENRLLSWYAGGLNFQIEHHLFPHICHVHYRGISKIVRNTANEYGMPYFNRSSFKATLWDHTKMMQKLGRVA